jgi:REP element-mobilizing transposase RayT
MAWAQRKRYRAVFLGHTHCPTSLRIRGQELWDSGDFVDSFSYIVLENGRPELHFL